MKLNSFKDSTKIILLTTFAVFPVDWAQAPKVESVIKQSVKSTPTPKLKRRENRKTTRKTVDLIIPELIPVVPYSSPPAPPPPSLPSPPETLVGSNTTDIMVLNVRLNLPENIVIWLLRKNLPEYIKYFNDFELNTENKARWIDEIGIIEIFNPKKESLLKIEKVTSVYAADFAQTAIAGKPDGATTEKLLESDYLAATMAKEQPESLIKEVKYLKVNQLKSGQGVGMGSGNIPLEYNLNGVYQMSDDAADKNRFVLTWHTYHLVDGTARREKIVISGKKTEMPVAEKIIASAAFEQKSRVPAASETFKVASINQFGISDFSLPANMTAAPVKEDKMKNGEVEWTTYKYVWKTPVSNSSSNPSLEVRVSTIVYNADFTKVVPHLPAEFATPEYLIQIDHIADLKSKKQFGDRIKAVELLNLNGTDGAYTLFKNDIGNFVAVWQTYRLLDGKAQNTTVTIEGNSDEILKAERIIKSFRLSEVQSGN